MVRAHSAAAEHEELRERLLAAALQVAAERGLAELSVRRIAEAAETSTMSVYSRFGGRAGVLDALYRRTFRMLGDALAAVDRSDSYVVDLALAYRAFALENPPRYAFMFGRPLDDFVPDEDLRTETLQGCFAPLIAAVRAASGGATPEATRAAYCLWGAMHGLVSLELAEVLQTPLPDWGMPAPIAGAGERMYLAGVRAVLTGLGLLEA